MGFCSALFGVARPATTSALESVRLAVMQHAQGSVGAYPGSLRGIAPYRQAPPVLFRSLGFARLAPSCQAVTARRVLVELASSLAFFAFSAHFPLCVTNYPTLVLMPRFSFFGNGLLACEGLMSELLVGVG